MITSSPRQAAESGTDASKSRGVVVRPPRPQDAIGNALRDSFDGAPALPDEFDGYIHLLDRMTSRH
jgi:hypothetical protein